jgi:hypothetical protein
MKIGIAFCGPLARYAGLEKSEIELPGTARFEDLLSEIGRRFGKNMPPIIWDTDRANFTHHVCALKGSKILSDLKEPLSNGEKIKFFLIMVGG